MVKVITYGTFDLFHNGHYRLLQRAKALGDYLIVAITTETFDKSRGKIGVIDPLIKRIENVKNTGFADEIIVEEYVGQKFNDVQRYNIDIFAIGSDWKGHFDYLKDYCQVVYLERTKDISSTELRKTQFKVYRMGVIGDYESMATFMPEANLVSGVNVQNIYNVDMTEAVRVAKKWDTNAFDELEKFYENTDLIYISSPPQTHYDYVKSALEHGKHVLCEKPLALKKSQVIDLFDYAEKNRLALFEGIETAYCPGFRKMLGIARSGKIGQIKNVEVSFTNYSSINGNEIEPFLKMTSYAVFPILKLMGLNFQDVSFDIVKINDVGDMLIRTQFKYPEGLAMSTCGSGLSSESKLLISGTKGYIIVSPPWWQTTHFEVHCEDLNTTETYSEIFLGNGIRYEINDLVSVLNGVDSARFKLTEKESIVMSEVVEKFISTLA